MSYVTLEVEIENGRIIPKGLSKLPEKASGLLTIFQPEEGAVALSPSQALSALQSHLHLNDKRAEQWMADVREARR